MTNEQEEKKQGIKSLLKRDVWSPESSKKIKSFFKKIFKIFPTALYITASMLVVIMAVSFLIDEYYYSYEPKNDLSSGTEDNLSSDEEYSFCNVSGIELYGTLSTYIDENVEEIQSSSYDVYSSIETADADNTIKAIILEIDSYGGSPVAGEEVALALKRAQKPTIAVIRGAGTSASYMAASGADKIFASKNSDVGGIGVTMSYLDYSEQNKRDGLDYVSLSSGKFKDYGNPDKKVTAAEKNLFMRDINILHQNFINLVAENRGISVEKVKALADGSTMPGEMALENGLIDYIGGFSEVEKYLTDLLGERVVICWAE